MSGEEHATIAFFVGDVKKNSTDIQIGEALKESDIILTGINSSCDIKIGESMIRIKENSKLIISQLLNREKADNVVLGLDVGKMLCRPKKLLKNENFYVRTPTAVAGVRGTVFSVEADAKKTTRIKVFKGSVNVVKRVDSLEKKVGVEKMLESTTPLNRNQRVVITEEEVRKAEVIVDKALASGEKTSANDQQIVNQVKDHISVGKKDIVQFSVGDFRNESDEIIEVSQRTPEVIKQIRKAVRREAKAPMPDGSLLVTRHDIYFIKNGKVEGEWKVINAPLHRGETIYVASSDYVFCASIEGSVKWRKRMPTEGKLEIKPDGLYVHAKEGVKKLDYLTGESLE